MSTAPTQCAADRPLCRLDALADGRSRGFDPLGEGRDTMFVVRRGQAVFAYRNACPHIDFARMAWKKDEFLTADRSHILCAAHGARFRIEDGTCEAGPCLGAMLIPVPLDVRGAEVWLCGEYAPGLRLTLSRLARTGGATAQRGVRKGSAASDS